jgi:regulator of RNase E activity RraA
MPEPTDLSGLDTSDVSDALDRLGINGQCHGIMPLDRGSRLAGAAFAVRYVPVGAESGTVGDYIDDLAPGSIVVLDNGGRTDATVWGDLLTATAVRRGIGGTVIDGVCRDSDRAVHLGYPVYSRGRWMRTGKDRVRVDGSQSPSPSAASASSPATCSSATPTASSSSRPDGPAR